ncbi:LamG domain-containing protein [Patescibacteria group bacterium]
MRDKLIQYVIIAATLTAIGGSYFYFRSEGSVTQKQGSIDGLVGYWDFEEGSGLIANDRSSSGNNGTITGATYTADSPLGNSLSFDGSNDIIDMGNVLDFDYNTSFSVCTWFKVNVAGGSLITKADGTIGYRLQFLSGKLAFVSREGGDFHFRVLSSVLNLGVWTHACGTNDGLNNSTSFKIYINGADNTETNLYYAPGTTFSNSNTFRIGSGFNGDIDEVKVYNRKLEAAEVANIYESKKIKINASQETKLTDGLVVNWTMDGNHIDWGATGAEVLDQAGSNDGDASTLGMDNSNAVVGKIGQALNFNKPDSEYVFKTSATGLPQGSSSFTSSAWINMPSPSSHQYFMGWGTAGSNNTNWLGLAGGKLLHVFYGNDLLAGTVLSADTWHHAAVTYDGITRRIYLDGEEDISPNPTTPAVSGNNLFVGSNSSADWLFTGKIDEARVYNRALSQGEITELYNQGQVKINASQETKLTDGLVLYQSFDGNHMNWEATGAEALDQAGNNDGGVIGATAAIGNTGQALDFDVNGDYINVGNDSSLNVSSSFSISTWIKRDAQSKAYPAIYIDGLWRLSFGLRNDGGGTANTLEMWFNNAVGRRSTGVIPQNEWTHIGATWNGTNLIFYINGAEDSTTSAINYSGHTTSYIGSHPGDGDSSTRYDGKIDDLRLYNRAITSSEMEQLYMMGK